MWLPVSLRSQINRNFKYHWSGTPLSTIFLQTMSGVFLTVWDDKAQHSPILRTTEGGFPHITLAYTGDKLDKDQLSQVAGWVLRDWALKTITVTGARVNSFKKSDGTTRHDVLLDIAEASNIDVTREMYIRSKFGNSDQFFYGPPHITHGIYHTLSEAQSVCDSLLPQFPYQVRAHGVTIDWTLNELPGGWCP